jgi:hypothetical protein
LSVGTGAKCTIKIDNTTETAKVKESKASKEKNMEIVKMFRSSDGNVHKTKEACRYHDARLAVANLIQAGRIDPVVRPGVINAVMDNVELLSKIVRTVRPKTQKVQKELTIPA